MSGEVLSSSCRLRRTALLITPAEHESRARRIAAALERHSIDVLVLLPGSNFTYLTGLRFARERYRLLAALFTKAGRLAMLGATFEEAKMGSGPLPAEVVTWSDEVDQYRRTAGWIEAACGPAARVGLEMTTGYYHYLEFRRVLPSAVFVDPTPATDGVRAIKSEAEIACLREAARKTRLRMEKVPAQLAEGMTERDLQSLFGRGAMIQFGLTSSLPNEVAGNRRLDRPDVVVIDAGDRVEGYRSDLTRTFYFGEPTARMRKIYRIVHDAELAGIEAARPGAPAEATDLAARSVIEKAGYGARFTHRGGHGIGLDFHEPPICVAGNKAPLEPGMVLTVEPGIYLPGEFGMRLEDDVLVTGEGHELLSERGPLFLETR